MIKKYAINKFVIATLCLVLFMIFYFFPTTENIKPEVIKENKSNYENVVYLIDDDNYVSRVICYYDKLSIVEDIKKKMYDNIRMDKWICVSAEKLYITNYDNIIFAIINATNQISITFIKETIIIITSIGIK